MQFQQNQPKTKSFSSVPFLLAILLPTVLFAQVNTVEFGKNRVQYRKFKWQYYQSTNFNTYFYENGKTIANYVAQVAENELPGLEQFVEYGLQRRANIVIYNHFDELQQSNIGLNLDWQTSGGITKLVNNKMVIYFDGDHANLRKQIRQGIARILTDNILFGDDLGEFATNQALLDLPKWLVDGYVDYVAEDWSPQYDNDLKLALLSGDYRNFYQLAYDKPLLAGHAFWQYIADKYKKENVTYFLYLSRVYRNLNSASQRICKKKFKEVLKDFMLERTEMYEKDLRGRRDLPKGTVSIVEEVTHNKNFVHFTPNPAPRSQTYAVVEFIKGQYRVVLWENMTDRKVLLNTGVRSNENEINPNYPLLAWDGKGTRLACIYWSEGKVKLFVYDMIAHFKRIKQEIPHFEQVQDMKFMLNSNTLLLSAVRNGQSDIYIYNIEKDTYEQVTNDAYADLDASFVAFPNKTGILFSSNRPDATTIGGDTAVASRRYNIFLADNYNKSEFRQITQLTKMKYGNARYPMQYNTYHFTFVSDETGIANRFAGFFSTKRAGLDTVVLVGDQVLRNPDAMEIDSTLKAWGKTAPDSVFTFSVTQDSAYSFPITNYQSALLETKIAGYQGMVSEVRQEGNLKLLYRLKVDESALKKRNLNPRPTEYRRKTIIAEEQASGAAIQFNKPGAQADSSKRISDIFETGFDKEKKDSVQPQQQPTENNNNNVTVPVVPSQKEQETVLKKAKLFDYKLKFSIDNFSGGFNNDILVSRYQPYTGSLPVVLQSGGAFNGMLKASVFDLFEDIRFTGAMRLPLIGGIGTGIGVGSSGSSVFVPVNQSLFDGGGEWYGRVDYLKHRIDYSLIYYRRTDLGNVQGINGTSDLYEAKSYTNLYQAVFKYPFDKVRSLRLSTGIRTDKVVVRGEINTPATLEIGDINKQTFSVNRIEYVHDDAIMKATNIWNGLRYKIYTDLDFQTSKPSDGNLKPGRITWNAGFDGRYYYPIYRNFIWAGRAAGDFSWGNQKIVYYLGGVDGWMFPKYSENPKPQDADYAFQSLAVNMRGFPQNVANGNNAVIINSEFRLPVFATLFNKPINNAFLRNFQVIQFIDLGSAWNGKIKNISRPSVSYGGTPVEVLIKAGGIGPFVGGYGFGARSTLLGYFLRLDAGWEMNVFFRGKPYLHFAMGVDF
ncbi:hypothetical protein A3860_19230 [Niastella vici]|uniref:Bacterial surface antigen (D15) domain-containing protein n=1 Tax=Niastella vici TaxID=1703345 RepID=A0A1V9G2L1_9BACT|nr:hypothetical protein [Niastella vici]OQP64885.1 hypothetical protein A3860_19230 [Niastella vici]